jgi:hypothetical protein
VAQRGIAHTSGWQVCQLYDPACDVHARCEESLELLALPARAARADAVAVDLSGAEDDCGRA